MAVVCLQKIWREERKKIIMTKQRWLSLGRFTLLDYLLDLSLNHIDNHFTNVNASNHGNPLQIKRKSEDLDTSKILLFF